MAKALKSRASKQAYVSEHQLVISGFETPFSRTLNPNNRWVTLAHKIPWDSLVNVYSDQMANSQMGAEGINPRVAIGSLIIKHICDLSDRETVLQIQENMYMQYFIGYSSFSDEQPFDPSLFVDFRKPMGSEQINAINERYWDYQNYQTNEKQAAQPQTACISSMLEYAIVEDSTNKGKLLVDATACPQVISYPADLNLLNDAREKSEELIDELYALSKQKKKPRTYREIARKYYLKTAQKNIKQEKKSVVQYANN